MIRYTHMSNQTLEVVVRDAIAEAATRPAMADFLKIILGDVLHELRLEEIYRSPIANEIIPHLPSQKVDA